MGRWSLRVAFAVGQIAIVGAGDARARDCLGVSFPDRIEVGGAALTLNGLGIRKATIFSVNVYVGALYLATTSSDPAAILAANGPADLVLAFVREIGVDDIRDAWSDGLAANAKSQMPALADRIATLNGWMESVKAGESLRFTLIPGTGTRVNVRGTEKGVIKGDDFSRALLSLWLGAAPPNADLKAGLLGGECK